MFLLILPFDFSLHLTSPLDIFWLFFPGVIEIISVYTFMQMYALNQLSVSTLVSSLRFIWTPLCAAILLGEILSLPQYLGILAIFIGAVISTPLKKIRLDPGIRYAFLFSIFAALLSITMKIASHFASTSIAMIAMSLPPIFIFPLLMKHSYSRIIQSARVRLKQNALATFFNFLAMLLYIEAMRLNSVGLVFSVFNGMAFLSILVGIVFLHETDRLAGKLLGTAAYLSGILLLT
jgi:drug/metabolite transporter (DMT)-like permease